MKESLRRFLKQEFSKGCNFTAKSGLNITEARFLQWAREHMWAIHRPSWPDYLVEWEKGEIVGVEVKGQGDWIRRNQRITFDLLSDLGMRIFIWDSTESDPLISWPKARLLVGRRRLRHKNDGKDQHAK